MSVIKDLTFDSPQAVTDSGLSFPPGEHADDASRRAFAAAVSDRFVDDTLTIRARARVFMRRDPKAA